MAKPAGGPKPPQGRKDFDEDDWAWCSPADAPLTLPCIHKTFSTCLFKAQQFGLFCRNGHILVNKVICESQMYGWLSLLFMFLVPNKRHLRCHVTLWILFSFHGVAELCSVIVDQSNYLYSTGIWIEQKGSRRLMFASWNRMNSLKNRRWKQAIQIIIKRKYCM